MVRFITAFAILFSALPLFRQQDSAILKRIDPDVIFRLPRRTHKYYIVCIPITSVKVVKKQVSITHENHSVFGLKHMYFRFDNKPNQMANMVAGVLSMDGSTPSIMGARPEATAYYIDGVRVMDAHLPRQLQE